jgi:hypothetical protein
MYSRLPFVAVLGLLVLAGAAYSQDDVAASQQPEYYEVQQQTSFGGFNPRNPPSTGPVRCRSNGICNKLSVLQAKSSTGLSARTTESFYAMCVYMPGLSFCGGEGEPVSPFPTWNTPWWGASIGPVVSGPFLSRPEDFTIFISCQGVTRKANAIGGGCFCEEGPAYATQPVNWNPMTNTLTDCGTQTTDEAGNTVRGGVPCNAWGCGCENEGGVTGWAVCM